MPRTRDGSAPCRSRYQSRYAATAVGSVGKIKSTPTLSTTAATDEHHLRMPGRPGQLQPERDRVVVDTDPAQLFAVRGHPHDHTAAPVQIDPDVLAAVVVLDSQGPPSNVTL